MVEKIDKNMIKNGRLIKVKNTNLPELTNADEVYFATWVEDADGGNERCLLFTEEQIKVAEERAKKNPEDLTKKNFIVDMMD